MPQITTAKYRTFLTQKFKNDLSANTVAYAFIGRPHAWIDAANGAVSDSNPSTPTETVQLTDFECWRDMLGAKLASAANSAIVVARVNWATNTVYAQYDDQDKDLFTKRFYVLDQSSTPYRVYKCLWN